MKCLLAVPPDTAEHLKSEKETGFGYQVVSVRLKDQREFDQVVVSEGCVIAVKGYADLPFRYEDVATVTVNHKRWTSVRGQPSASGNLSRQTPPHSRLLSRLPPDVWDYPPA